MIRKDVKVEDAILLINLIMKDSGADILELHKKTKISKNTFYNIIKKNQTVVRLASVNKIAKAFNFKVNINTETEELTFEKIQPEKLPPLKYGEAREIPVSAELKAFAMSVDNPLEKLYNMIQVASNYGITEPEELDKILSVFLKKINRGETSAAQKI